MQNDVASDSNRRATGIVPGPVALFIDWDNFAIGLRQEMPERPADVGPILRWVRHFGPLMVCRAYGEWRDPAERLAIYNAGVEVVYAPVLPLGGSVMARDGGGAKSLADTAMAVDVTEMLSLMPGLSTVVMATSDKDLIPVLRFAQRRGLNAVVIGSDRTAAALRDLADEFASYRQLLEQESSGTAPVSRPSTVPPMRYQRAPRTGSASAGSTFGASAAVVGERRAPRSAPPAPVTTGTSTATTSAVTATRPSVGSVFANEAEEEEAAEGTAASRRRRRGGRRRRAGELAAEGAAAGTPQAAGGAEEEETAAPEAAAATPMASAETPAAEAVPAATEPDTGPGEPNPVGDEAGVQATPGSVSLVNTTPVAGEEHQPAAETGPGEVIGAEPRMPRPTPSFEARRADERPVERRAPVVLPGERLRRLAPAPPPEPAAEPEPTPAAGSEASAGAAVAEGAPTGASPSAPGNTAASPAEQESTAPGPMAAVSGGETAAQDAESGESGEARGARRGRRRAPRGRGAEARGAETAEVAGPGEPGALGAAEGGAGPQASGGPSIGSEASDATSGRGDVSDDAGGGAEAPSSAGGEGASEGAARNRRPRRRGGRGR